MQTVLFWDRTDTARQLTERLYLFENEIEKSKSSVVIEKHKVQVIIPPPLLL
jgi:hypothetical protein